MVYANTKIYRPACVCVVELFQHVHVCLRMYPKNMNMPTERHMYACIHTSILENKPCAECIYENTPHNMVQRGMLKLELKLLEHNFL